MSRLHDLNFFLKLALASLVMMAAWLVRSPPASLLLMVAVLGLLAAMRLPGLPGYLKGSAILLALVTATWWINLTIQGEPAVAAWWTAVRMAARLVTTTAAFFFVMETSSAGAILAAATAARLPPMAALCLALVFGLIPMLREEFERIADAQRARGLEIDDVPLPVRLRYGLARGVPLLVQGLRMAQAISLSLAVSGFDRRGRRTTWRNVGAWVESRLPSNRMER